MGLSPSGWSMTNTIAGERWCPRCKKLFLATRIVGRQGREEVGQETPCPACGTRGEPLLAR